MPNTPRGRYNSSITRVRPFFEHLLQVDPTGLSWLSKLLLAAPRCHNLPDEILADPGHLLHEAVIPRPYRDRVLDREILLAGCFEHPTPPSRAFLHWLISNPRALRWPESTRGERIAYGAATQQLRTDLIEPAESAARDRAMAAALTELDQLGPSGSRRKWWAFEGFTEVDCWLETEKLVLFVEGKRTEPLSSSTHWFEQRSQLVRNLEVAGEIANGKSAAVLVVSEEPIAELTDIIVAESTPHLTAAGRETLAAHYLGQTTWLALCESLNVPFDSLPRTIDDLNA